MTKNLVKIYSTLSDAEKDLKIEYIFAESRYPNSNSSGHENTPRSYMSNTPLESLSPISGCSPYNQTGTSTGDNVPKSFAHNMTPRLKKQLVDHLFKQLVVDTWGVDFYSFVHSDFLEKSLNA